MFINLMNFGPPMTLGEDLPMIPGPHSGGDASEFEATMQPFLEPKAAQELKLESMLEKGFMDSFESEFQMPTTRLVEALKEQPTEAPAIQVVEKLGLSKEDQEKAQAMLLAWLGQGLSRLPQSGAADQMSSGAVVKAITFEMNQRRLAQKQESYAPVLTVPFYGKIKEQIGYVQESPGRDEVRLAPKGFSDGLSEEWTQGQLQDKTEGLPASGSEPRFDRTSLEASPFRVTQLSTENSVSSLAPDSSSDLFQQRASTTPMPMTGAALAGVASSQVGLQGGSQVSEGSASFHQGEWSSEGEMGDTGPDQNVRLHAKASVEKSRSRIGNGGETQVDGQDGVTYSNLITPETAGTSVSQSRRASEAVAGGLVGTHVLSEEGQAEANVQNVLRQTNFLIKQGGGEAHVKLHPEGIGEVQLNVRVIDGKVEVQLRASSHEAKDMLEGGFRELRKSLAKHDLSMDQLKVDVVASASKSTQLDSAPFGSSQDASDNRGSNQQQQSQQQQQFWTQFHQNFGGSSQQDRSGYADLQWARDEMDSGQPLKPMQGNRPTPKRYAGASKGSSLNMVA